MQDEDSNTVDIERALVALVEKLRQAAYDEGYADASSVALASGCPPEEFGQQGDLG